MWAIVKEKFGNSIVVLVVVAFINSGCALVDPYPTWQRPKPAEVTKQSDVTLDYAIKYAQNARDAYREKLSQHARLINSVTPALITLAGVVIALAAFDSHVDNILGVGIAGGTGYAVANHFSNNTQELVYLAGMKGMSCAIDAVLPLNFGETAKSDFASNLSKLSTAQSNVSVAIGKVKALIPIVKPDNPDLAALAEKEVAAAETLIAPADTASVAGAKLARNIDTVGSNLVAAVDRIDVAVDEALQQAQPRLESVINAIGQLSKASNIFVPGVDFPGILAGRLEAAPKAQSTTEGLTGEAKTLAEQRARRNEDLLVRSLNMLTSGSIELASLTRQVTGTVNSVNEKRPLEILKDCGVEVGEVTTDITVVPQKFTNTAAGNYSVIVNGGKSPYVARLLNGTAKEVSIQNPIPGDRLISVTVSEDAKPGTTYTIYVADAAGHAKSVTLTMSGTPPAQPDDKVGLLEQLSNDIGSKVFALGDAGSGRKFTVESTSIESDKGTIIVEGKLEPSGSVLNEKEVVEAIGKTMVNGKTITDKYKELGELGKVLKISQSVAAPKVPIETVNPNTDDGG